MPRTKELKGPKLNKRQIRQVKRIVSGAAENKYVDTQVLATVSQTGFTQALNMPSQGDGINDRIGNRIRLKKLDMRLTALGADSSNILRVIVWRWRNDSNATPVPSLTTLLEAAPTYGVLSPYNWQSLQSGQIHIIYDRTFTLDDNGTDARVVVKSRYGKKLGKKYINFLNDSTANGNDIIYVSYLSDSGATSHPGLGIWFRMHYEDS